jgi:hypothetical protein
MGIFLTIDAQRQGQFRINLRFVAWYQASTRTIQMVPSGHFQLTEASFAEFIEFMSSHGYDVPT